MPFPRVTAEHQISDPAWLHAILPDPAWLHAILYCLQVVHEYRAGQGHLKLFYGHLRQIGDQIAHDV